MTENAQNVLTTLVVIVWLLAAVQLHLPLGLGPVRVILAPSDQVTIISAWHAILTVLHVQREVLRTTAIVHHV